MSQTSPIRAVWQVFLVFLQLGLSSFGGPVAHLGYFREALVRERRWLSEQDYADLVALCQFLPGPASSQVGMGIGLMRAGHAGALAAWLGFTMPSALLLIVAALGLTQWGEALPAGLLHGLKLAALAVVAQAVWGMGRQFCNGRLQLGLMLVMAVSSVVWLGRFPVFVIPCLLLAGLAGRLWLKAAADAGQPAALAQSAWLPRRRIGIGWLLVFAGLLAGTLLVQFSHLLQEPAVQIFAAYFQTGSLVFGGGHVVLPLLQGEVVGRGWVNADTFMAGYGLTQAVPGPLFTFAAFLGAASRQSLTGWAGGLLALTAIFLPAYLLLVGVMPFWERWCHLPGLRAALQGINAAVVGLLAAALWQQVRSGVVRLPDLLVIALALWLLVRLRWRPWLVVLLCALAGWGMEWLLA